MRKIVLGLAALLLLSAVPAVGGEDEKVYEWEYTLIHSDLPLYDFEWDDFWPRGMVGEDIIAGCETRVAFGDWQFTPNPADQFPHDPVWYRLSNYGAFHCATNIRTAPKRDELDEGPFSRGFFARIGEGRRDDRTFEIWVLQQGMIPGSEYTLLARNGGKDDLIRSFRVLQSRCPKSNLLKARNLDVWQTRYCKINDRHQLLRFARRMLREPDYGTLELIEGVEEGPETEAPDPIDNPKN
ncbi:hypothetical protein [Erythrobacter sp.]|uniref:hypothetical protein n=1 Tax=Erythrobacter sp. TaxID=1042 RepID=UPI001B1B1E1E|nr:hypothetical protein [Erythrobacter sp.]MBO6525670.1 hypothetical protein [Erythrobacter sp.]MBO6529656.1 hypothetical protein [Erythrobacter sp.]